MCYYWWLIYEVSLVVMAYYCCCCWWWWLRCLLYLLCGFFIFLGVFYNIKVAGIVLLLMLFYLFTLLIILLLSSGVACLFSIVSVFTYSARRIGFCFFFICLWRFDIRLSKSKGASKGDLKFFELWDSICNEKAPRLSTDQGYVLWMMLFVC